MSKIRIEMEERQLRVVIAALDLYARLGMGQWEILIEFITRYFKIPPEPTYDHAHARVRTGLNALKQDVFGMHPNESMGIANPAVPLECREAYDIRQVLAKVIAPSWHVDNRTYLPTNEDWPPVACVKIEEST